MEVPVCAVVSKWLSPVSRVDRQTTIRGDRIYGRPPVQLGVDVGTPGIAVHPELRRDVMHDNSGLQLIPVGVGEVDPNMYERLDEQTLGLCVVAILPPKRGEPGGDLFGRQLELESDRVGNPENRPNKFISEPAEAM